MSTFLLGCKQLKRSGWIRQSISTAFKKKTTKNTDTFLNALFKQDVSSMPETNTSNNTNINNN